jgi:hypothetical protein
MSPAKWNELLEKRGVDRRIASLIELVARTRNLDPPTTDTSQLLVAIEPDGYAAGRKGASVLSLFFTADRARRIGEAHNFSVGPRSDVTWIVRIPAAELDDRDRRELARQLLEEAIERVAPMGSWTRGLPDAKRIQGDICLVHGLQRSLTGVCPMCE